MLWLQTSQQKLEQEKYSPEKGKFVYIQNIILNAESGVVSLKPGVGQNVVSLKPGVGQNVVSLKPGVGQNVAFDASPAYSQQFHMSDFWFHV